MAYWVLPRADEGTCKGWGSWKQENILIMAEQISKFIQVFREKLITTDLDSFSSHLSFQIKVSSEHGNEAKT